MLHSFMNSVDGMIRSVFPSPFPSPQRGEGGGEGTWMTKNEQSGNEW